MWFAVLLTSLSIASSTCHARRINTYAGPYDYQFKHFEHCPDESEKDFKWIWNPFRLIRSRKSSTSWYYNGTVNATDYGSDDYKMTASIASWSQRGGWVPNAHRGELDRFCSIFKSVARDFFVNFTNSIGVPPTCPLPKGFFEVKNFYFLPDIHKLFPVFPYGKYRMDTRLVDKRTSTTGLCGRFYLELVPKA